MSPDTVTRKVGAEAAAAPAPSPWRPLIVRTVVGALALFGLSGIGAVSMLAGLDGAHASPPSSANVWTASASASAGPVAPSPTASTSAATSPVGSAPDGQPEPGLCPARTNDGRVILNLAGVEDLRKIPGIGPKRAEAILSVRARLKRFKRASDLLRVRGIGPKSLARMQPHFVVDPPAGSNCSVPNAPPSK
jgi:competence protein ComEA